MDNANRCKLSYNDFLEWCEAYEREAFSGFDGSFIVRDAFHEALSQCKPLKVYLDDYIYKLLIYRLAMHFIIVNSDGALPPLNSLTTKYQMKQNTGLISQASDKTTSATKFIGGIMQNNANLNSMLMMSTPYGKYCESIFESLQGIPIVIK